MQNLSTREWFYCSLLLLLALYGAARLGAKMGKLLDDKYEFTAVPLFIAQKQHIPNSKRPGLPREDAPAFKLAPGEGAAMQGKNSPLLERWADIQGNFYSEKLVTAFSYEKPAPAGPSVRVRHDASAPTFRGRIEARGLKPNFAYQMKLLGDWSDRAAAERIGYAGRWRLPGTGTNFTNADYELFSDKELVEAYIFFDYFVTDANGNATRDFALDSSLHVLWSATRQYTPENKDDSDAFAVDASSPLTYACPKPGTGIELLWTERERSRYKTPDDITRLPAGKYKCFLTLTEESFHSKDNDGGYWATVMRLPVEFEVTQQE